MAIYFGDELRRSNSSFPIIDISENNAKGVVFIDSLSDWDSDAVSYQKITVGMIIVDRDTGNVYVYKGDGFTNGTGVTETTNNNSPDADTDLTDPNGDGGASIFTITDNANWKVIGNTPIFSANIVANIGAGNTFGKYGNEETVPLNGKTALEAIKDALTSFQAFTVSDIADAAGSDVTFGYDKAIREGVAVASRKFNIRNKNRSSIPANSGGGSNDSLVPYGIRDIKVHRVGLDAETNIGRIYWGGSAWVQLGVLAGADNLTAIKSLNTFIQSASTSYVEFEFSDSIDIAARTAGDGDVTGKYEVEVVAVNGEQASQAAVTDETNKFGSSGAGQFVVEEYEAPTVALTTSIEDTTESGTAGFSDIANERSYGNVESSFSLSITKNESSTTISKVEVFRGSTSSGTVIHEAAETVDGSQPSGTVLVNSGSDTYTFKDLLTSKHAANVIDSSNSKGEGIASAALSSIAYTVRITDDGGTGAGNTETTNSATTINFKIPVFSSKSAVNPTTATASTLEGLISGGVFLKKNNNQNSNSFYKVGPTQNGSDCNIANPDNVFVDSIGASEFVYICLPNAVDESSKIQALTQNGADPGAYGDFGGEDGKATMDVTFSNSVTAQYRLYANAQSGSYGGSYLDLSF